MGTNRSAMAYLCSQNTMQEILCRAVLSFQAINTTKNKQKKQLGFITVTSLRKLFSHLVHLKWFSVNFFFKIKSNL